MKILWEEKDIVTGIFCKNNDGDRFMIGGMRQDHGEPLWYSIIKMNGLMVSNNIDGKLAVAEYLNSNNIYPESFSDFMGKG